MVKTTESPKFAKRKQTERLKLIRNASIRRTSSSSSSSAAANQRNKRSSRLSVNYTKKTTSLAAVTALTQLNNDDNLSIYSREDDENNLIEQEAQELSLAAATNKTEDEANSDNDIVTYSRKRVSTGVTRSGRGRKKSIVGRKKKRFIVDSDSDDHQEEEEENESDQLSDYDGEKTADDSLTTTPKQLNSIQTVKFVQITHLGKKHTINTFQTIDVITQDTNETDLKSQFVLNKQHQPTTQQPELPKVNVEILNEYPNGCVDYKLPVNFIKYIENTNEELDEQVEYDMDEEDTIWLETINEQRLIEDSIETKITQEEFEVLMDRLEKESYFQSTGYSKSNTSAHNTSNNNSHNDSTVNASLNNQTKSHNDSSNEDALCCICLDGECLNTNAILFCDMCNLAVHQECYGVPYIPEGQWLCRRCIQSPSAAVNCILCPNRYGAFKQTDRGLWCHVICAIWIPEVHFANTVFLEPVIGIENIDRARWKLMCYICRKKNAGACIQCDKNNCYTAFHVTCAQQAGLYMNINEEQVEENTSSHFAHRRKKSGKNRQNNNNNNISNQSVELKRRAYCDIHTPIETLSPRTRKAIQSAYSGQECEEAMKRAQRMRMKKARKILAERRNAPPQVCMPVLPSKERCDEILDKYLSIEKKENFFVRLVNYWTLKRYSRNGVPILRRLQQTPGIKKKEQLSITQHQTETVTPTEADTDQKENDLEAIRKGQEQLAYWKKMRQDLETTRLLMELVRKRERLKRESIRIEQLKTVYELNAFNGIFLQRTLEILKDLDKKKIFHEPVDLNEVPTYSDVIHNPMDFSKMQSKINRMEYITFSQFEADFDLIINNCLLFNQKNSFYYKTAFKLREQAGSIIKQTKRVYSSNLESSEPVAVVIAATTSAQSESTTTDYIDSRRASICSNETATSLTTIATDKSVNITKTNKKKTKPQK